MATRYNSLTTHSKDISSHEATMMLSSGEAVRSGTKEHKAMMLSLWEGVAERFVFVASLGKWVYRQQGTDKGSLDEKSAQTIVDVEFRSPKLVLRYGSQKDRVKAGYEAPVLADAANGFLTEAAEERKSRKKATATELPLAKRLIVDVMDTYPNKPSILEVDGLRVFNLWTPPKVKAIGAEKYQEPRWFLDVVDRFFGPYEAEKEYFLDWCAHLVCRPEVKMPVSVLLTSKLNGAGKGFMAEALEWMVGKQNCKNLTASVLKSGFQSFVGGTMLAIVHELYEQGNASFADMLKPYQSEDHLFANVKYGPMEGVRNNLHFLAFSNRNTPLQIDEDDRRWFTFASPQTERANPEWWGERWQYLKNRQTGLPHLGALGSLRRWFELRLAEIDATGRFDPFKAPPMTEHKRTIVEDSRHPYYLRVQELLDEGSLQPNEAGLIKLSDIESPFDEELSRWRVSAADKRKHLEEHGFSGPVRTKAGNFWRVPEGYQPQALPPI